MKNLKKFNENFVDDMLSKTDPSKPITRDDLVGSVYDKRVGYSYLPEREVVYALEFVGSDNFVGVNNSEEYLEEMGYSIGSMEQSNPIAFCTEEFSQRVPKWGSLNSDFIDSEDLIGVIITEENYRSGSALVLFFQPPNL